MPLHWTLDPPASDSWISDPSSPAYYRTRGWTVFLVSSVLCPISKNLFFSSLRTTAYFGYIHPPYSTPILTTSISPFSSHLAFCLVFSPWKPVCATRCSWMCGCLGWFEPPLSVATKGQTLLLYGWWRNFLPRCPLHVGTWSGLVFHQSHACCHNYREFICAAAILGIEDPASA